MADKTVDFQSAKFSSSKKFVAVHEKFVTDQWAKTVARVSEWPGRVEADWARGLLQDTPTNVRAVEWYIECALSGARLIRDSVVVDPDRRGGVPVLTGTGFTVSQTLVELADSSGVTEVADEFELDADVIRKMLNGLSLLMEKPHSS